MMNDIFLLNKNKYIPLRHEIQSIIWMHVPSCLFSIHGLDDGLNLHSVLFWIHSSRIGPDIHIQLISHTCQDVECIVDGDAVEQYGYRELGEDGKSCRNCRQRSLQGTGMDSSRLVVLRQNARYWTNIHLAVAHVSWCPYISFKLQNTHPNPGVPRKKMTECYYEIQ